MIEIKTRDSGHPISSGDISDAQDAYETVKAYRRIIFMRAIAEKRTYKWVATHSRLSAGNVFQLVNKTNYKKK